MHSRTRICLFLLIFIASCLTSAAYADRFLDLGGPRKQPRIMMIFFEDAEPAAFTRIVALPKDESSLAYDVITCDEDGHGTFSLEGKHLFYLFDDVMATLRLDKIRNETSGQLEISGAVYRQHGLLLNCFLRGKRDDEVVCILPASIKSVQFVSAVERADAWRLGVDFNLAGEQDPLNGRLWDGVQREYIIQGASRNLRIPIPDASASILVDASISLSSNPSITVVEFARGRDMSILLDRFPIPDREGAIVNCYLPTEDSK